MGLLLIAIGTGGIKPCVSAFGADQVSMTNVLLYSENSQKSNLEIFI